MNSSMKKLAIAATAAIAVAVILGAGDASARTGKHYRLHAPPPPSWGYYASIPITIDNYAQAQAMSLEPPYYSHFMYDYCDYRNCVLRWSGSAWLPVWYGPVN